VGGIGATLDGRKSAGDSVNVVCSEWRSLLVCGVGVASNVAGGMLDISLKIFAELLLGVTGKMAGMTTGQIAAGIAPGFARSIPGKMIDGTPVTRYAADATPESSSMERDNSRILFVFGRVPTFGHSSFWKRLLVWWSYSSYYPLKP